MMQTLIAAIAAVLTTVVESIKQAATVYVFTLVIPAVSVAAAATTIKVAEVTTFRVNQGRAIATDLIRHPIDLNLALNPALHGNRDQLDKQDELVRRYMTSKGIDSMPTYFTIQGLTGGPKGSATKGQGQEGGDYKTSRREWLAAIDKNDEDERARQFYLRREAEEFNAAVGGSLSQGIRISVDPVITDPGAHGLEFTVNVLKTRQVVTLDNYQLNHNTVIDLLGDEEYTESFKVKAFQEAGVRFTSSKIKNSRCTK